MSIVLDKHLGKYQLQELLGRGGMAEVWQAFDTHLERYVAIKLLHGNLRTDPNFILRFTREARMIAALHHPNIVQIYDFQISNNNVPGTSPIDTIAYMVMEYIKGQTLAQYIHRTSHQGQFPSADEVLRLFTPISLAIDYAHQQGMIHRDIKPANILLDASQTIHNPMGEPILLDFGLAKLLSTAPQPVTTDTLLGTPLYISPEQVQNRPISKQTDIYALGAILYEVFTGVPPFQGDSLASIMMQRITSAPTEPHLINPALPAALSTVLLKSLALHPQERFPSATMLTVAIAEALHLPTPEDLKLSLSSGTTIRSAPASPNLDLNLLSDVDTVASRKLINLPITVEVSHHDSQLPDNREQQTINSQQPIAQTAIRTIQQKSSAASILASPKIIPVSPLRKYRGKRFAMLILLGCILLLVGSGFGTFQLSSRHTIPTPVTTNIVGQAFFVSSGQTNLLSNQGLNDELQLNLQHISDPQTGKSYYAWLLPDANQTEGAPVLLGQVSVSHGSIQLLYTSDNHTNLLATFSRFLVTEEDASTTPEVPSPDLDAWRYYAELPQKAAPEQTYSQLDHLRHLLATDPILESLHLHGGLSAWAERNILSTLQLTKNARDAWNAKNITLVHQYIVSILDYLDGTKLVQQDVPDGTAVLADPLITQVGLLELSPGQQSIPGYLYHIALHVNGVLSSPGTTPYQRHLAAQINIGINDVSSWLQQIRQDAVQLVYMDDTQLALPSSLALLNDMLTHAADAYQGYSDPSTGKQLIGISQIYRTIQHLATFEVTTVHT